MVCLGVRGVGCRNRLSSPYICELVASLGFRRNSSIVAANGYHLLGYFAFRLGPCRSWCFGAAGICLLFKPCALLATEHGDIVIVSCRVIAVGELKTL